MARVELDVALQVTISGVSALIHVDGCRAIIPGLNVVPIILRHGNRELGNPITFTGVIHA